MNLCLQSILRTFLVFVQVSTGFSKLVKHVFEINYGTGTPDGVVNNWILKVNRQFPGPAIHAEVGDTLIVDVFNKIKDEQNLTIHWHGIHQKGSPFQDGPSMITQCPLRFGDTQRYEFLLDQVGTYWYHSHVRSQYTEGLWGSLIVHHKPDENPYPSDHEITISLNEAYHLRAKENEDWYLSPQSEGLTPFPDSLLLNGLGRYPCNRILEMGRNLTCKVEQQRRHVFPVPRNKDIRIRVINTSSRTRFNFSVDGHPIRVVEVDGVDVANPPVVDKAEIAPAQRYSFLISTTESTETGDRFLIRGVGILEPPAQTSTAQHQCNCTLPEVTAVLAYDRSSKNINRPFHIQSRTERFPYTTTIPESEPLQNERMLEEAELLPMDGEEAPAVPTKTIVLNADLHKDPTGAERFAFNGTFFKVPEHEPLLYQVVQGKALPNEIPYEVLRINSAVRIIINNYIGEHPFHLHGHHFYVVGKFPMQRDDNGKLLPYDERLYGSKFNTSAVRRDTVLVDHEWIVVIDFIADNPGVWHFHCHIDWHNLGGMAFTFVEAPLIVRQRFKLDPEMLLRCDPSINNEI